MQQIKNKNARIIKRTKLIFVLDLLLNCLLQYSNVSLNLCDELWVTSCEFDKLTSTCKK